MKDTSLPQNITINKKTNQKQRDIQTQEDYNLIPIGFKNSNFKFLN